MKNGMENCGTAEMNLKYSQTTKEHKIQNEFFETAVKINGNSSNTNNSPDQLSQKDAAQDNPQTSLEKVGLISQTGHKYIRRSITLPQGSIQIEGKLVQNEERDSDIEKEIQV